MNAYLVYRPVMDYEESMEPHLVCSTRENADECVRAMREFSTKLAAELSHQRSMKKKQAAIDAAQWPYGIALLHDINIYTRGRVTFDCASIAVMELPIDPPSA